MKTIREIIYNTLHNEYCNSFNIDLLMKQIKQREIRMLKRIKNNYIKNNYEYVILDIDDTIKRIRSEK